MLNGYDNENGFKTNRSNQQKHKLHVQDTFSSNQPKNKFARAACFFVFPLPLFCTTTMLKLPSYMLFLWRNCYTCLPNILFPVFVFAFIFHRRSLSLFLATSISHFPTAALNFHVFLSTKFVSFFFKLNSLQLFLFCPRQCKHKK